MTTAQIIAEIYATETAEDVARVDALIREQPGQMAPEVQAALMDKLTRVTAASQQLVDDTKAILALHGVNYDLDEWVTVSNYAKRFDVGLNTVTNWIARGIVPADHVKEIPELGLKLIKAVEYKPGKYTKKDA